MKVNVQHPGAAVDAAASALITTAAAGAVWVGRDWVTDVELAAAADIAAPGLLAGGAALAVARYQSSARGEIAQILARTLTPQIGRAPEAKVRLSRWESAFGVGAPRRITITYDATAPSEQADWLTKILEGTQRRLRRRYTLHRHDQRHCKIVLRAIAAKDEPAQAPDPFIAERAEAIVKQLLGSAATFKATWEEDRLIRIEVKHSAGLRVSPHAVVRTRIEATIEKMLPARWRARWDLINDEVVFEVRPALPDAVRREVEPVAKDQMMLLPYAVDEDGHVLVWSLSSSAGTPHFLVNGATGAGKTVLIRGLVLEAARRGFRVRMCDPKRVEFVGLKAWPNIEIVATSVPDIVAVIADTAAEMERRYQLMETGEADAGDFDPLILVLDEFRYFYGIVNTWWQTVRAGTGKECPILDQFNAIAILGRTARIHLIVGTQRPDAAFLGGDTRDQFGARASLGRLSPEGARMMWGAYHVGVSVPRGKPGRGTALGPEGEPGEAQSFWTPDPTKADGEDIDVLHRMRPSSTSWPRRVVVPPAMTDEDGEPLPLKGSYEMWRDSPLDLLSEHPELERAATTADQRTGATAAIGMSAGTSGEAIAAEDREQDLDELYEPTEPITVAELSPGHLLLVDEPTDVWGVVETVEEDIAEDGHTAICWRSDDGEDYGVLSVAVEEPLSARKPREDQQA